MATRAQWDGRCPHSASLPRPDLGDLCAAPGRRGGQVRPGFHPQLAGQWRLAALVDVAGLVISELVTNALRHGMAQARVRPSERPIRLRLLGQPPYVMCMVTDPGSGIPVVRDPGRSRNGRGLNVVESCCVRWGWHLLDGGGKVVWALMHPDG